MVTGCPHRGSGTPLLPCPLWGSNLEGGDGERLPGGSAPSPQAQHLPGAPGADRVARCTRHETDCGLA